MRMLFLLFLYTLLMQGPETVNLQLQIDNIQSQKGKLYIAVYRPNDNFLGDKPYQKLAFTPQVPSVTVNIPLPRGKYAFAVLDDEDGDKKMDSNLLGIPEEGYGVSHNAAQGLTKPSFEDAVVTVNNPQKIEIKLVHW